MLTITVGAIEVFDESTDKFRFEGGCALQLEHSLVALSKWEAIHEKPFLGTTQKTSEEILSYIACMVVGEFPRGDFLHKLSQKNFEQINAYIEAKMSATWFSDRPGASRTGEIITSELIYYWMTAFNIPFACETWHINRLFNLIRVNSIKQSKPKKMSRSEIARRNHEINAQRKAQLKTTG